MTDRPNNPTEAKILIVDDNEVNIQILTYLLEKNGYSNVVSTSDSREAKSLFNNDEFDLILLDIRMPHLDGFQVMEQLQSQINDDYLPVLVLTAETDRETRLKALKLGAKDFLTKPFDTSEVLNRIRNMIEVRALYNERRKQAEILEEKVRQRTVELHERNEQLEETRLEIIRRLGRAGEYRDNETGMHVIRMSMSSKQLALAAGESEDFAEMVLKASPMHDVGKIGVPDNILLKPGKLDADEWEIMKSHAEIGADIIGVHDAEVMLMAQRIALTHHEKWDGSGYPRGLSGEDIPLESRICAICDVFDALTSVRPYKDAWPVEKAVEFINENSGSHFDPRLVDFFNQILPVILSIREEYADTDEN